MPPIQNETQTIKRKYFESNNSTDNESESVNKIHSTISADSGCMSFGSTYSHISADSGYISPGITSTNTSADSGYGTPVFTSINTSVDHGHITPGTIYPNVSTESRCPSPSDSPAHKLIDSQFEILKTTCDSLNDLSDDVDNMFVDMRQLCKNVIESNEPDIIEREPIEFQDIPDTWVLINIPTIYPNASDDQYPDISLNNTFAIEYDILCKFVTKVLVAESSSYQHQYALMNELIDHVFSMNPNFENTNYGSIMLKFSIILDKMKLSDDFIGTSSLGISFDVIRKYECDPFTHLLKSATEMPYMNYYFYSQLENEDAVARVREYMNDTDYNRIQYTMLMFEKTMLFEPDRAYDRLVSFINVYFLYLCLLSHANPLKHHAMLNMVHHYLSLVCDSTIRSRHIEIWRKHSSTKSMISDISNNYKSHVQAIIVTEKAPERFANFMSTIKQDARLACMSMTYDNYLDLLKTRIITIPHADGIIREYYELNQTFLRDVISLLTLKIFDDLI